MHFRPTLFRIVVLGRRGGLDDKSTIVANHLASDVVRFQVITATFFTLFRHILSSLFFVPT